MLDPTARIAISDLMNRYFMAIDVRDFERLATCFTEDVDGIYEGVPVAGGRDRIMEFFTGRSEHRFPLEIIDLQSSMHFMGNHVAVADGEGARAETYAIAHLIDRPEPGTLRMRSRGLRYLDHLVVEEGEWRIRRREHLLAWMRHDRLLSSPPAG